MTHTHPASPLPCRVARIVLVLLAGFMILSASQAKAQDISTQDILTTGVLVPKAVGMALAGDAFSDPAAQVSFAKKPNASGFLKANDAHLADLTLFEYGNNQLNGMFVYMNDLGRRANYGFEITYKTTGTNQYLVQAVRISPFEPLMPRIEVYFVPAGQMSLKQMKAASVADLLRYARANTDRVTRDAPAGPIRDYDVLAFCMERLMDGAGWELISTQKAGTSWSKGGWHVAVVDATFSVNGRDPAVFQVFHTKAKKSVEGGKTMLVGTFTNQYLPPIPPGPSTEVATSPEIRDLLDRYRTKALPNLQANP